MIYLHNNIFIFILINLESFEYIKLLTCFIILLFLYFILDHLLFNYQFI